jgi:uncharacterized membrane protein
MSGMNWGIGGAMVSYLLVALFISITPYINARMVLFGIFVPEEARDNREVSQLRMRYVITVWLITIVMALIAVIVRRTINIEDSKLFLILVTLQIVMIPFLLLLFRVSALRLKQQQNWQIKPNPKRVASLHFPRGKATINNVWYSIHLLIVVVCVICAALQWDSIPQTLVTHYGIDGVADGFSEKSLVSVFELNFIQLVILLVFIFANVSIRMSKQSLDPNNPEQSLVKQLRFRKIMSLFLWGLSFIVVLFMGLVQGSILYEWSSKVMITAAIALPIVLITSIIILAVYLSRNNLIQQTDSSHQEDNYWKAGIFYYNPEDPALFVSKRIGIGWTVNFAHPISWIIILAILLIPIVSTLISVSAKSG